jgi:hypothetical protein
MRVHICRSTFIIFFSQILFVWLITSVSYCHLDLVVAFFCRFSLSTCLFIFYLWHIVCHIGLLRSFSDNFVVFLATWSRTFFWCYHLSHYHIISFHYLPFAVLHYIISFHYMIFVAVIYISLQLDSATKTSFYDDFKELNFGCNFSFHVISLSVLCNLIQMQRYCICLTFERGC